MHPAPWPACLQSILFCVVKRWPFLQSIEPKCKRMNFFGMRNCLVPRQACCCVQSSDSAAREQLEKVVEVLDTRRCRIFEDCIAWARHRFQVRHNGR